MGKCVMLGAYLRHDCLLVASQVLAPNRSDDIFPWSNFRSCIALYSKSKDNSDNAYELDMLLSGLSDMIWMVCWSVLLRIWLSYTVLSA